MAVQAMQGEINAKFTEQESKRQRECFISENAGEALPWPERWERPWGRLQESLLPGDLLEVVKNHSIDAVYIDDPASTARCRRSGEFLAQESYQIASVQGSLKQALQPHL